MPRTHSRTSRSALDSSALTWAGVFAALAGLWVAHSDSLRAPLTNDDYLLLLRTADGKFWSWWGRHDLFVGWWRPWSRETHFGWLQAAFGANETAFHAASFLLVAIALIAYALLTRRFAGARAGAWAVCGVAALAAWGYPIRVAAGAQDLWMLIASLVAIGAWAQGRAWLALVAFALALASKETAALLPAILIAHDRFIARRTVRATVQRALAPAALLTLWIAWHPHLGGSGFQRLGGAETATGLAPPPPAVLGRTLAAIVNLDIVPAPEFGWGQVLGPAVASAACLLVAWILLSRAGEPAGVDASRWSVVRFASVWALAGWAPLLLPGLGWHPYYVLFGALGAWLALGVALERMPPPASAMLVLGLSLISAGRSATLTHAWADTAFLRRAANYVQPLRASLLREVPSVRPHTRLYFTGLPAEIGFVTGEGPMFPVLYRDPTLSGALLGSWLKRPESSARGEDMFFHGESGPRLRRMVEGPAPEGASRKNIDQWAEDQRRLGVVFLKGGDPARAGDAFGRVAARLPGAGDDAETAAQCYRLVQGDSLPIR